MKQTSTILLVEDHSLLRQALKSYIEVECPQYQIEEATNGRHAIQRLEKKAYDLLVTDINMPKMDGFELTSEIKKNFPNTKVLVVSMFIDHNHISKMLEVGVDGYVSKNTSYDELIEAIEKILDGETYFSNEVTSKLMNGMRFKKERESIVNSLSKRELEVLYLVLKEHSNKEIASELFISTRTVETHKYNLLQKTNSKSIAGLFKFAIQNELFKDLL